MHSVMQTASDGVCLLLSCAMGIYLYAMSLSASVG